MRSWPWTECSLGMSHFSVIPLQTDNYSQHLAAPQHPLLHPISPTPVHGDFWQHTTQPCFRALQFQEIPLVNTNHYKATLSCLREQERHTGQWVEIFAIRAVFKPESVCFFPFPSSLFAPVPLIRVTGCCRHTCCFVGLFYFPDGTVLLM